MYKSYFKIGWRNLARNKGYSIINVSGLALSMTCVIFIFSLVKQHLSFDNFHDNSDRIYRMVTDMNRDITVYQKGIPSPLGEAFRNDHTFGEKVARVFTRQNALITLKRGEELIKIKESEGVAFSEATFFGIFNFPLLHGDKRTALTESNTAILTERIAKKYFGDQNPVGETFWLENQIALTVTGVLKNLPPNTDIKTEIFISYPTLKSYFPWLASDTDGWGGVLDKMQCYVLLRPDVPATQVEVALLAYAKKYRPHDQYKLQPLADIHFNGRYEGVMEKNKLWALAVLGIFLMATACVNFVNLATAQALRRAKEVGVRKVLGGFKIQLFWQFIFETGIIAFASVLLAGVLSYVAFPYVNDLFKTQLSPDLFSDWSLLLFVFILGLAVTFLAGYYPGLVLAAFRPVAALKGKLSQENIGGFNTRRTLIVSQFAISQVLIIGMIVIMNQMRFAMQSDLGFNKDAVVMIGAGIGSTPTTMNTMKNEISKLPGVEKLSLCYTAPLSDNDWGTNIRVDNKDVDFRTSIKSADDDYVSMFDLELLAGRNLLPSDTAREMLVNEAMIRKLDLKSPEEALGRIITANAGYMTGPIVGIVKDFHDKSFREEIHPILITTYSTEYSNYAIKLNLANAKSTLSAIEKIWLQQHPDQIFEYNFLDQSIARFYETEEVILRLVQVFSLIAIFIGSLGLYGLVSFMVSQKTKEIGIRKVLGCSVHQIVWIFGKEFSRLIVIAFLISCPIAWYVMNAWLQNFKFHIDISVSIFMAAIISTFVIASLTVVYQAIKAALMNPVNSLRSE